MLINPGSVGFPRSETKEDVNKSPYAYAQYALFNMESGQWQFKQACYDKTNIRNLMDQNGLR
jgi:hypothetical protein